MIDFLDSSDDEDDDRSASKGSHKVTKRDGSVEHVAYDRLFDIPGDTIVAVEYVPAPKERERSSKKSKRAKASEKKDGKVAGKKRKLTVKTKKLPRQPARG